MKYLITILGLIFCVSVYAADFAVEEGTTEELRQDKNYIVKYYAEKEAQDGSTVTVVERTDTVTLNEIERRIERLQERATQIKEDITELQAIKKEIESK